MLSPGKYHVEVPKDPAENKAYRRWLRSRAKDNPRVQAALAERCRQDILFYINGFVYQFNPNAIGAASEEVGPFITWDFQDGAIRALLSAIEDKRDVLFEKSRQMGASWLCLIVIDWFVRFNPNKKFLVISRSEEAVEKPGDSDSLFWKLDYIYDRLPRWLLLGYDRAQHRRKRTFVFPNGSSITGQASTGKAGVGGTATSMFIDEFSQIDEDYEVLSRTSDTTSCRIFNGTHLGMDTAFYELTQRVDMRKIVMHWSQHPDRRQGLYSFDPATAKLALHDEAYYRQNEHTFVKDGRPTGGPYPGLRSPWYDLQCTRKHTSRAVAMDLDIDPQGSVSQVFDPVLIRELQSAYCRDPYWQGDVLCDPDTGKLIELVKRRDGPLRLWLNLLHGGEPPPAPYAGGADISRGRGKTPSCISFVDCSTGHKVLEYTSSSVPPDELAAVAVALCNLFRDREGETCLFAWEKLGPGEDFGDRVIALGYRRVYFRTLEHVLLKRQTDVYGWSPTPSEKDNLLGLYNVALRQRTFINRSREALEECLGFKHMANGHMEYGGPGVNADPSEAGVNHGDHVIADALACKMKGLLGYVGRVTPQQEVSQRSLAGRRLLQEDGERRMRSWR